MTYLGIPFPEPQQRAIFEKLVDVTADSAELNALDGFTGTPLELNLNAGQVANIVFAYVAGTSNIAEITMTLKDAAGVTVAAARPFLFWLSDAATGAGLTATSASGTVAAKASSGQDMGAITAKKALWFQPLATGVGIIQITDTAKTGFYPCVLLPNGKTVVGTQLVTGNYG